MSMVNVTPIKVMVELQRVHCIDEADGSGEAAPFLWTAYFKIDGTTAAWNLDLVNMQLVLSGKAALHAPGNGAHGNLGFKDELGEPDVDAGQSLAIPAALGAWRSVLRPIPLPALAAQVGKTNTGAISGYVAVLLEEDNTPDDVIVTAHGAFVAKLKEKLGEAIGKVKIDLGTVSTVSTDSPVADILKNIDVESMKKEITAAAEDAISDAVTPNIVIAAVFLGPLAAAVADQDDTLGKRFRILLHDEWPKDQDFTEHWSEDAGSSEDGEWQMFGRERSIDARSLRANLRFAGANPAAGVRKAVGSQSSVLAWIRS